MKITSFITMIMLFWVPFCAGEDAAVKADKLSDYENAIVLYNLTSNSGDVLQLKVQYDSAGPQSQIFDVHFTPIDLKSDGSHTLNFSPPEGGALSFICDIKDSKLINVKVDTDYRPTAGIENEQKVFTIKSKGGYEILITFDFKNGTVENVSIKPAINPFSS